MPRVKLWEDGRITLPAAIRRKLGWEAGREFQVEINGSAVVIHAIKTLDEVKGIFHEYVRGRKPLSDEEETILMERAVAEQVAHE